MQAVDSGILVDRFDKGLKMWPDIFSVAGKPLVKLEEIDRLGFRLVSCHVFEKGASYGNILAATRALADQSLEYVKKKMTCNC